MLIGYLTQQMQSLLMHTGNNHKRKEARVSRRVPVYYRFKTKAFTWKQASTLNLSEKGACVELNYPVQVGEKIEIEVPYHQQKARHISKIIAEIRWVDELQAKHNKFRCGILFKERDIRFSLENNPLWMLADQQCRLIDLYVQDCYAQPVKDAAELKSAYNIVYQEYVARHICPANNTGMFYNFYNMLPTTKTLLLKKHADDLGTISMIQDSMAGLPMESIFPEEIQRLRDEGCCLVEVGGLALNSRYFNKKKHSFQDLWKQACFFKLCRGMFHYARDVLKATDLVIGVHPKHEFHYKYMKFQTIGPARSYPGANGKSAILMRMDVDDFKRSSVMLGDGFGRYIFNEKDIPRFNPYSYSWSSTMISDFLFGANNIWDSLTDKQKQYINKLILINDFKDLK